MQYGSKGGPKLDRLNQVISEKGRSIADMLSQQS